MGLEIVQIEGKGRGIIATTNFNEGDVLEECPIIILNEKDTKALRKTVLEYYQFPYHFSDDGEPAPLNRTCLAMGYASLLNTCANPNARWAILPKEQLLIVEAERKIKKGEEITMSYGSFSSRLKEAGFIED